MAEGIDESRIVMRPVNVRGEMRVEDGNVVFDCSEDLPEVVHMKHCRSGGFWMTSDPLFVTFDGDSIASCVYGVPDQVLTESGFAPSWFDSRGIQYDKGAVKAWQYASQVKLLLRTTTGR